MGVIGYIIILIYNVVLMLVVTLIIAALTLIERKVLSLAQRRVGPNYVGFRGRLQYVADALKLFLKGIVIPDESNKFWFVTVPAIAVAVCYSFWINSVWGPSVSIFELEYNIVFAGLFSILFAFCIVLTGYFSRSKYAFMASIRCCLMTLNLEIFLGLFLLNSVLLVESFCFTTFVIFQEYFWFIFIFFGVIGLIVITFLLETNRTPYDLSEAESELVAGYTVEYGGFFFGAYYLGEYLHLFFFSVVISILVLGGWEYPTFLNFFFLNDYIF